MKSLLLILALASPVAAEPVLGHPLYVANEPTRIRHSLHSAEDLAQLLQDCLANHRHLSSIPFGQLADEHPFSSKSLDRPIASTLPPAEIRRQPSIATF